MYTSARVAAEFLQSPSHLGHVTIGVSLSTSVFYLAADNEFVYEACMVERHVDDYNRESAYVGLYVCVRACMSGCALKTTFRLQIFVFSCKQ